MADDILARFDLERGDFRLSVDARLPGRGITALFGRSGSGKTSMLRCMAGLELANNGLFRLDGRCWQNDEQGIFVPPHRRQLSYIVKQGPLYPHMHVRENLEYAYRHSVKSNGRLQPNLRLTVDILDLDEILQRYPHQLNAEQKRRVAIGRALMAEPQILLLDEPLGDLEPESKVQVMPYLEKLHMALDIPVIYVTHDVEELLHVADHLVTMQDGRVLEIGRVTDLLPRLDLELSDPEGAAALLEGRVAAHDDHFALTLVSFEGGELLIPKVARSLGEPLRIRVQARDVSLSLDYPRRTTFLNILDAHIIALLEQSSGFMLVRLDVGGTPLFAQITRKAKAQLGLKVGMRVFAQVKNSAIYG